MKKEELLQSPARLELSDVTVTYDGHTALEDISFVIDHGDQVAVVGPNGAGKSTLFKVLVGLVPVRSGNIRIHGLPLGHHQDCVAYMPQREEVDWKFPVTVEDVVMMGRYERFGWLGRPAQADRQVVKHSLEQMGIESLSKRRIEELSGGQQQRTFLARALAQEPHILLMDEPFTGVDVTTQETTLVLLERLREQQVTVLVSTHDLNMASERFKKVMLINHRLIALGSPAEVFTPPNISAAFGSHVLYTNGAMVVDQCCPGDEERSHA
jgi:manganese/iron transport system ATP-binding protein